MRTTSSHLASLFFLLTSTLPAAAQVAPPGEVTSEDLLDFEEPAEGAANPNRAAADGAAAPADAGEPREREAEQAFTDGDLARALMLYRDLAAHPPAESERSRLRVTAAWLEFQLGNPAAASLELVAALMLDPVYQPKAGIYSPDFMALFQDARRDAAEERERLAGRLLKQGIDALTDGDSITARQRIEESLTIVPGSLRGIAALAQVDLAEFHTDAALAGFERVLALERGAPKGLPPELKVKALNNVGFIYFGRGQYEDSVRALEEASRLNTRDPRVWFNLGLARQKLGLDGPALEALRTAHELDRRDAEVALELGRALSGAGRWLDAVSILLGATQAHPESAVLWLELAFAQRGLGNSAGMTASLGKVVELDPSDTQGAGFLAAMALAQSSLSGKNFGQAIAAAEAAVRMRPEDGSAWALLGLSAQASGRLPEAALNLERALAVAPDRPDIAHNLGTVYLAQRRYPEAATAFRLAVSLDPGATESVAALSRLEAQQSGSTKEPAHRSQVAQPVPVVKPPSPAPPAKPGRLELGARLTAVDYPPLGIRGLLVESVVSGGLAELSGLLVDDLVLRAGGRPLTQPDALRAMLESSGGNPIQLSVLRSGKPVEVVLRVR